MTTNKTKCVRLGDYIEVVDERNCEGIDYPFCGINKDKTFMPTVADTNNIDNTKYKLVTQGTFVFSGMQTGRDVCIRIALQSEDKVILVSPAYTTFRVKRKHKLSPLYLYMQFIRFEMDRYGWFLSDGSIRSNLDWDRFCDIRIPLPSMEVQRELVATYEGLKRLAEDNEALVAPLTEACQAFIVDCKRQYPSVPLGDYIEVVDERNTEGKDYPFCGVNKDKCFMPTVADTNNLDNKKYKLVKQDMFVFSGMQTGRDVSVRIAYQNKAEVLLVSPAYTTYKVKDASEILPQFLYMQFARPEVDRLGWFLSDGSIRSNLDWDRFCTIQIPLPPLEVQQSIVNLYHCIEEAKSIARETRERLTTLCPALVQYAINA